jgi:GT2 family glycosyltransferase
MEDIVVAIVVTYNRKELLTKCLNAILRQTVQVSKIVIVDNASTDNTEDHLRSFGYLDIPLIDYRRLPNNTGGAGGFKHGLKFALDYNAEWFWLLDDDVAPEPSCLKELIKYKEISECLHPRIQLPTGSFYEWEHCIDVQTCNRTFTNDISFKNGKNITFVNVGCFEGMLISRRVVDIIGLPDERYFITDDDTLYGFKASIHTNVSYIKDAVMRKLLPLQKPAPWRWYYIIRNRFFLRKDSLQYIGLKSQKFEFFCFVLRQVLSIFVAVHRHGLSCLKPCAIGFIDGLMYSL